MKFPHSGYHWNCGSGRFFEGWYYRVTLPEVKQSFAFMYAIDDPQGGTRYSGGSLQVLGVGDRHIWRTLPNCQDFYGSRDSLDLHHWNAREEGYAASDRHNEGKIYDPVQKISCTWNYQIEPVSLSHSATMGATMGWLSYLPVFAPGWQILMLHGWGTGFITWGGLYYEFENAPVYMEKNWGGAFPEQWFWIQCNSFSYSLNFGCDGDRDPNLSLIVAGGKRKTLGMSSDVAMVMVYYKGELYKFMPDNSQIYCEVEPWGSWKIRAYNQKYQSIEISGQTDKLGMKVMVPTAEGLKFRCRDTAMGKVKIGLNINGKTIHAQSDLAALETGGGRTTGENNWEQTWRFKSASI
jgi:tocopherol cyclase